MRYGSIQALRAIAANMVVVSHISVVETKYGHGYSVFPPLESLGRWGVDIFFVISGFVIALVAMTKPTWRRFLWDRVTRIYPIYWLYTAVVLAVAAVAPFAVNSSLGYTPSIVESLLLWPQDGLPWLAVGWSLVHEMYFYIAVALILALRINFLAGLAVWSVVLILPIEPATPFFRLVLSPLTFEFIAGAILAVVVLKFSPRKDIFHSQILETLGDASYSVYLSHVLVISALGRIFMALPWHGAFPEVLFVSTCLIAANIWGWLSFRCAERPLMQAVRNGSKRSQLSMQRPLGM